MYEENTRSGWASLFIKIIIIVIFVLFTIWLLSLSTKNATKGLANSLDVLTDKIFSENIDRMKEVGKSYFTTERLPEKVGDVKTLTLAKMYDENLILEIKDKNGNACSAKNSYVAVEKMENEYQMKVYLECGEESHYIISIMGCYNYCNTDICERKEATGALEYEYSKTVGGSWGPWGNWSEWSKTSVTKTDYREIETKTVKEDYTYYKTETKSELVGDASCPVFDDYKLVSIIDGVCQYTKTITDTVSPNKCASTYNGYDLVSQDGFTCNYSKTTTKKVDPNSCASEYNGYTLVSQDGFTCNYSKPTTSKVDPNKCASKYNGYDLVSQDGFTCNYSKTTNSYSDPICPEGASSRSGFTCSYTTSYQVPVDVKTVVPCSGCGVQLITIYETRYETTTRNDAYCKSGYTASGNTCVASSTATTTTKVGCPDGYTASGSKCVSSGTATTTTTATCPDGYKKSGSKCALSTTATTTTKTDCPTGYEKRNNVCAKDSQSKIVKDQTCAEGLRYTDGKCYKDTTISVPVTEKRDVVYYRYRLREYTGGTTDYKWSTSNNDKSLLDAGYKLTGKTRSIGGK